MYHYAVGDYFILDNSTTFTTSMHKASAAWWVSVAIKVGASLTSGLFWSTAFDGSVGQKGVSAKMVNSTTLRVSASNGTGSFAMTNDFTITALTAHTDYVITVTFDDTAGTLDLYINGVVQNATGKTMSSPATNGGSAMRIDYGGGSDGLNRGHRLYAWACGNAYISSGDEDTIRSAFGSAHNRTYE